MYVALILLILNFDSCYLAWFIWCE